MSRYLNLACSLFICLSLAACSGATVRKAIPESDKDPSLSYDGRYAMIGKHPGGRQELTANWFINCSPVDFRDVVYVKNSEVVYKWSDTITMKGFVDSDGRFRLSNKLNKKIGVVGGVASDGSVSAVIQGVLDENVMKGALLFAQAEHVGRGCTYPLRYELLGR